MSAAFQDFRDTSLPVVVLALLLTGQWSTPVTIVNRHLEKKRYLTQHIGGRKCQQRKELLTKSTSFTLALSASPGTLQNTAPNDTTVTTEKVKFYNHLPKIQIRIFYRFVVPSARKFARILLA